jgi:signal transduction histidine kinase
MKTVLVLSSSPAFPETIAAGLDSAMFKIVHRMDIRQAEPLLQAQFVDVAIVDLENDSIQNNWTLEQLKRVSPRAPIIAIVPEQNHSQSEEDAYLNGASHVLTKPLRVRALAALLERLSLPSARPMRSIAPAARSKRVAVELTAAPARSSRPLEALNVVRDFSVVLTQSLEANGLLREFLMLLRGILGVNRAAIFLRDPAVAEPSSHAAVSVDAPARKMRSAFAVGLVPDLINHIDLSYERGIGGLLAQTGRILRRDEPTALENEEIQKEFEVLGAEVAVPILDREAMIGVALFDGRVTGEPLLNIELESIFHLLEGLALAVRNIWLHEQMASNSELLAGVLRELSSACVVVSAKLQIVHANKSARQYFARSGRRGSELEFSDLPSTLGGKIFQVLKTGTAIAPFRFESGDAGKSVYQISVVPLHRGAVGGPPETALLIAEDRTQAQQLQQLEVETGNLRLVRTMADRLAHEIGNALVPLSTHQQLLADKYRDPEFRSSLEHAMAEGVKRVSRLANQMRYLARDAMLSKEPLSLKPLIQEAYEEAQKHFGAKASKLQFQNGEQSLMVAGDRAALRHAMSEVLLNALQANSAPGKIEVSADTVTDSAGSRWVQIAIEDAGEGFTAEAAKRVPEPFFTTRNVGLGLGLTVSRKIIEVHHGRLQIEPPKIGHHGLVRISLPAEA